MAAFIALSTPAFPANAPVSFTVTRHDDGTVSAAYKIGDFSDALVMPAAQWDALSDADRAALAQARVDSEKARISAASSDDTPNCRGAWFDPPECATPP